MSRLGTDQVATSDGSGAGGHTAEIGTVIDKRYRITGILGEGGMGSVYRAEHIRLRRPVAIKLLHSRFSQVDDVGKRFEREAFAAGRLDHPNCVNVSDFGELEDGTLYLVMELVDGISLDELIEHQGPLPIARALHITEHVLRGLGHVHQAGIVHRDVKPANVILVVRDGDADFARLLDFGIAKLMGETASEEGGKKLTQAGVAFGTPLYLSPEQACGGRVDHRADLYSTSVMLFQMVTGEPPFDADTPLEILMKHATAEIPRLAEVAPHVQIPEPVETLIRRGLAKKSNERFADATEYLAEIQRCRAVVAPPANPIASSPPTELLSAYTATTQGVPPPPSQTEPPLRPSQPMVSRADTPAPMPAASPADSARPSNANPPTRPSTQQVAPLQSALTGAFSHASRATSSAFENAVRSLTNAPLPSMQRANPPNPTGTNPTTLVGEAPRRKMRHWWWIGGLALLLLIIIASL